jgi:predicted chitinase
LLGFLNSNLAVIITLIIGVATVAVSINQAKINEQSNKDQRELQARLNTEQLRLQSEISTNQLKLQSETSEAQRNLEMLKASAAQEKDLRTLQFDIARAMLEKRSEIGTQDLQRVYYLREVVMSVLPKEVGLAFTRSAAENATEDRVRSAWSDGYVKLSLNDGLPPENGQTRPISIDYVVKRLPALRKVADAGRRIQDILDAAKAFKLEGSEPVILAYALFTSNFFKEMEEDFNLRSEEQVAAAFPSVFSSPSEAKIFVGDARALASKVYSSRFGNDKPSDAWNYRGRGYLRTTGKAAYARYSELTKINLLAEPGKLADSSVAAAEIVAVFAQLAEQGPPLTVQGVVEQMNERFVGLAGIQAIYEKLVPGSPKVTEGLPTTTVTRYNRSR